MRSSGILKRHQMGMSFLRCSQAILLLQSNAKAELHKLHAIKNDFAVLICAEC
jgi:hypothetical protein